MGRARVCDVLVKRRQCFFLPDPKAMVKVALAEDRSVSQNIRVSSEIEAGVTQLFQAYVSDNITPWDSSTAEGRKTSKGANILII